MNPSVLRGRLLRLAAIWARSAAECSDRSVPLGRYWGSSPLVFSFDPRCQGGGRGRDVLDAHGARVPSRYPLPCGRLLVTDTPTPAPFRHEKRRVMSGEPLPWLPWGH